jgi:hypothetical protein
MFQASSADASAGEPTSTNDLLNALWRSPQNIHFFGRLDGLSRHFKNLPVSNSAPGATQIPFPSGNGDEIYFACAEYATADARTAANAVGAYAFWLDIDCGTNKAADGKGYEDVAAAQVALLKFCGDAALPQPNIIVGSGGGIHVYWVLTAFVPKDLWQASARKLKAAAAQLEFLADPSRTADIASVLRLPGTLNRKYDPPKLVTMLKAEAQFIPSDQMLAAIDAAIEALGRAGKSIDRGGPHDKQGPLMPTRHVAPGLLIDLPKRLRLCEKLLAHIDPGCGRPEWLQAMMAVFHHTQASSEGFELFDQWSSKGHNYHGTGAVAAQWRSLRLDADDQVKLGTLILLASNAGADTASILNEHGEDAFDVCDGVTIDPDGVITVMNEGDPAAAGPSSAARTQASISLTPLSRYSLINSVDDLEKQVVEEVKILGEIALQGQATVIYAAPNVGKTLLALSMLTGAIKNRLIEPSLVYYINMDDNSKGLLEKGRLATEYGFNLIADGYRDFEAKEFRAAMEAMIDANTAKGVIVVIDTLKKFVNTMDKTKSSGFAKVVRQFVLKGGTVIALAHVNKNLDADGKPKFSGTSDIVDDFDCAYTLRTLSSEPDTGVKVVEFENIKRRGAVALTAGYSYALEREIPYTELLLSVKPVDPEELIPLQQETEVRADAHVISAIEACITAGINSKMKLAEAASERAKVSKRAALKVIERYTGADADKHRWTFDVRDRGAKVFAILARAPDDAPQAPTTP